MTYADRVADVHPTQEQKILLRIEEIQRGRIGIYPHHVASSIASEFGVSLPEATNMVLQHIKNEMKGP